MADALTPLLAFAAVIALIPLALWLLKRTPLGAGSGQGPMSLVASLPLSPTQRLLTVEVGSGDARRWLVLGVTPNSISTLFEMAAGEVARPAASTSGFAQLLRQRQHSAPVQAPHAP